MSNTDTEITLEQTRQAIELIDQLTEETKNLSKEQKQLYKTKSDMLALYGRDSVEFARATKSIQENNEAIKKNRAQIEAHIKSLKVADLTYKQLGDIAKELKGKLNNIVKDNDKENWEEYSTKLKDVTSRMAELDGRAKQVQKSMTFKDSVKSMLPLVSAGSLVAQGISRVGEIASQFISEAWEKSKQVQSEGVKAAQVFGDELGYVEAQAAKSAKMAGLTNREFVAMATNTADLLVPIGFSRKEAAKMSVELQKLTGALTEWSGGKYTAADVSERVTKAMLGETEGLKSLGIAISLESNEYKELYKQKVSIEGITQEQAKALAIEELIMRKSADAQQAYAEGGSKLMRIGNDLSRMWRGMTERVAYYIATTKDQRLNDQARELKSVNDEMINNESIINKLLPRYEELKGKSELNTDEQIEFKNIISEIQRIMPGVGVEIDKYGQVIGINTDIVKQAVQASKALVLAQNETLSDKLTDRLSRQFRAIQSIRKQSDFAQEKLSEEGDDYIRYEYTVTDKGMGTKPVLSKHSDDLTRYSGLLKKESEATYSIINAQMGLGKSLETIAEEAGIAYEELEKFYNYIDKDKNPALYNTNGKKKTSEQLDAEDKQRIADNKTAEEQEQLRLKKIADDEAAKKQRESTMKRENEQKQRNAAQEIKDEENRQKQLIETTTSLSDDLTAKEKNRYQKRLQDLKLSGNDKRQMTDVELRAFEALEREHNAKLQTIEDNRQSASLKSLEESQSRKITKLKISQAEEIASFTGSADKRKEITEKHELDMRNLVISNAEELKQAVEIILGNGSLSGGIDVSLLSDEQRAKLEAEVEKLKLLIAQVKGSAAAPATEEEKKKPGYSFGNPNEEEAVDLLGVNSDDLKSLIDTVEGGKAGAGDVVGGATMAITAMSNAYGMYDKMATAAEAKQLKTFEKNAEDKKQILRDQLSANIINQEQYNARVGELDAEVDAKRAEIELKQAKRNKVQAIFDTLINTGIAIVKALPNVPLAIAVGAMGAIQTAMVAATPLPGKEQGGFMVEREDGKMFNATLDPARRGYISNPTVIRSENGSSYITGENGTEYVIPAAGLRNPEIAAVVANIERARVKGEIMNLNLIPQMRGYDRGGYTAPVNNSSSEPITTMNYVSVNDDQTAHLIALLERLERNGVKAKVYMTGEHGIIPMMNKLYERQYNTSMK